MPPLRIKRCSRRESQVPKSGLAPRSHRLKVTALSMRLDDTTTTVTDTTNAASDNALSTKILHSTTDYPTPATTTASPSPSTSPTLDTPTTAHPNDQPAQESDESVLLQQPPPTPSRPFLAHNSELYPPFLPPNMRTGFLQQTSFFHKKAPTATNGKPAWETLTYCLDCVRWHVVCYCDGRRVLVQRSCEFHTLNPDPTLSTETARIRRRLDNRYWSQGLVSARPFTPPLFKHVEGCGHAAGSNDGFDAEVLEMCRVSEGWNGPLGQDQQHGSPDDESGGGREPGEGTDGQARGQQGAPTAGATAHEAQETQEVSTAVALLQNLPQQVGHEEGRQEQEAQSGGATNSMSNGIVNKNSTITNTNRPVDPTVQETLRNETTEHTQIGEHMSFADKTATPLPTVAASTSDSPP